MPSVDDAAPSLSAGNAPPSSPSETAAARPPSAASSRGEARASDVSSADSGDLPQRRLSLQMESVELLQLIGDGAFGRVHMARVRFGAEGVAAKVCALKSMSKTHVIFRGKAAQVAEECRILGRVHTHPFVMTQLKAFQTSTHLHLMTELAVNGDLYAHLKKRGRLPESTVRFYAAEVLLALEHCHERGVVYRDLKPENVLLCGRGHVRLADFGLAVDMKQRPRRAGEVPKLYTLCGSDDYVAPDVLRGHGYGPEVDLWALGCLTYELLTGCPPFNERTLPQMEEMAQKIRARESLVKSTWPQEPPGSHCNTQEPVPSARHATFTRIMMEAPMLPSQLSAHAKDFLTSLLQKTPSKRKGFEASQRAVLLGLRDLEDGSGGAEGEPELAEPIGSILSSSGSYDDCIKKSAFFAPLGSILLEELIDGIGPLPHRERGVRRAVQSVMQRLASRRSRGSTPETEEEELPTLLYLPKHLKKQVAGLQAEQCAESGKFTNASSLSGEKLKALRELGNSIFDGYPFASDSLVRLEGQACDA